MLAKLLSPWISSPNFLWCVSTFVIQFLNYKHFFLNSCITDFRKLLFSLHETRVLFRLWWHFSLILVWYWYFFCPGMNDSRLSQSFSIFILFFCYKYLLQKELAICVTKLQTKNKCNNLQITTHIPFIRCVSKLFKYKVFISSFHNSRMSHIHWWEFIVRFKLTSDEQALLCCVMFNTICRHMRRNTIKRNKQSLLSSEKWSLN